MCVPLDVVASGVGPTWFVALLQLFPTWFDWGVSYLPYFLFFWHGPLVPVGVVERFGLRVLPRSKISVTLCGIWKVLWSWSQVKISFWLGFFPGLFQPATLARVLSLLTSSCVTMSAKGLSPRISMYLGNQYASSWSVMLPFSSHCPSLSVLSISNWVLNSFEQRSRWAAVSHILQLGHLSSGHGVAEYRPTWTLVPQKPEFCLNLQILYMPGLFFSARSRCSKSTLLNCSFGHGFFFLLPKYCLATSLLAWNLIAPTICHLEEACVSTKCIYWRRPTTVSIYIHISLGLS